MSSPDDALYEMRRLAARVSKDIARVEAVAEQTDANVRTLSEKQADGTKSGAAVKTVHYHEQPLAATPWVIPHEFAHAPRVAVLVPRGSPPALTLALCAVTYPDEHTVHVVPSRPEAGVAILL